MEVGEQAALEILQKYTQPSDSEFKIEVDGDGIILESLSRGLSFRHSFRSGPLAQRAKQSNQLLLKACNNKQRNIVKVLDLTAGWGADALALARHGQQVVMLEQHELVFAMLAYALARLGSNGDPVANSMSLTQVNALDYLRGLPANHGFDCIYIDPMFPAHKSGAKPAKEMQLLQALTDNLDIEACFEQALKTAHKRVVLKRPAKADGFSAVKPDLSHRERSVRFDVYLTR